MNRNEQMLRLITALLVEQPKYNPIKIPEAAQERWQILRSLMNLRPPMPAGSDFLALQDTFLQAGTARKGITRVGELAPLEEGLYLWQGDITTLQADAIVNAANSQLLGCFVPCHGCIDNAIHTYAGVQLRQACHELMIRQEMPEPTGAAKITPGYNLPADWVIHTVGPIVNGGLTPKNCSLLQSCYYSCLALAEERGLQSLAFCCISTGEFHFPPEQAAAIAVKTVKAFMRKARRLKKIVFNVYRDKDLKLYQSLLGK
ncbi:protein-ADP-ribose hydrolase [Eubacterium sp. 1001713B170207_170306_E7]|uniref:protein-ADP-ribose hydrolase n=1 Tax=Eubacterium sp. 1001713B170207_170306_E7 TaxID=2787097 RepID=UPI0018992188|nr:protein-ADP-ribose hydrolase [Eubacterium sp. 1001713B170207_170306_E7]